MATRSTLNVSLTPELEAFVQETVKSGQYQSASEVVREALRLLCEAQSIRQARLAKVRADIAAGFEQIKRGDVVDGETVKKEILEMSRRARASAA